MDEYIKREDALKALDFVDNKVNANCVHPFLLIRETLEAAGRVINRIPAADVVPKSEVERLQEAYNNALAKDIQTNAEFVKYAKAEVAREIFAEIDEIFVDYKIDRCLEKRGLRRMVTNGEDIEQRFAELKKKYTEGESNG